MQDGNMPDSSDADLVARALDADHTAFAAIYDRYADRIHDFCWSLLRHRDDAADATQDTFVRAAERLGQLRDPSMLRSWLYSIAKHEALARLRARRRQVPDESVPDTPDVSAGPESAARQNELRDLVWAAAAGLAERDRVLLDLHLRHGLDGAELAEAAGIRANNVYMMLGRFRERVERSLGALLVARLGRDDCAELDAILTNWDGRFSVLIRKRVARHVDDCAVCGERRRTAASPVALLSSVPIMTAPPELREIVLQVLSDRTASDDGAGGTGGSGGRPWRDHPVRTGAMFTAGIGAVTAAVVAGASLLTSPSDTTALIPGPPDTTKSTLDGTPASPSTAQDPTSSIGAPAEMTPDETGGTEPSQSPPSDPEETQDSEPPPEDEPDDPVPPGELALSSTVVDFGAQASSDAVTLSNVGGSLVAYDVASQLSWLSLDHSAGELEAESARELVFTVDRSALNEGDYDGTITVTSDDDNKTITVSLAVENSPIVDEAIATHRTLMSAECSNDSAGVSAVVSDESEVTQVDLVWTGPDGGEPVSMIPRSGSWYSRLGPYVEPGPVTWHVIATDARGNTGASAQQVLTVEACPGGPAM